MADAKLREQRINGPDLHAGAAARIAQIGGGDVIVPIRREKGQRREAGQELCARPWAREALQQFLQDEAGGEDRLAAFNGANQGIGLLGGGSGISSKGQRPDARINKEAQSRERPRL